MANQVLKNEIHTMQQIVSKLQCRCPCMLQVPAIEILVNKHNALARFGAGCSTRKFMLRAVETMSSSGCPQPKNQRGGVSSTGSTATL